jgi:hypothetical protein
MIVYLSELAAPRKRQIAKNGTYALIIAPHFSANGDF